MDNIVMNAFLDEFTKLAGSKVMALENEGAAARFFAKILPFGRKAKALNTITAEAKTMQAAGSAKGVGEILEDTRELREARQIDQERRIMQNAEAKLKKGKRDWGHVSADEESWLKKNKKMVGVGAAAAVGGALLYSKASRPQFGNVQTPTNEPVVITEVPQQ